MILFKVLKKSQFVQGSCDKCYWTFIDWTFRTSICLKTPTWSSEIEVMEPYEAKWKPQFIYFIQMKQTTKWKKWKKRLNSLQICIKFLLRKLANRLHCNSQHEALMNRFPVMMTATSKKEFNLKLKRIKLKRIDWRLISWNSSSTKTKLVDVMKP